MEMPLELPRAPQAPAADAKAIGFRDPLQPQPTDPATRGRIPTQTPQAMFLLLFLDEEDADVGMMALQQVMPEIGRFVTQEIGNTLMRHDSRLLRRWWPLKDATLKTRKAQGRQDSYPYSDRFAFQWQTNRWGQTVQQSDRESMTVGIGPSEATQAHPEWSKTHLSQYGTPPGHGDGPHNVQQKVSRPLGLTEEIAQKAQEYLNQRLPVIMRNLGATEPAHAILAPDMIQSTLPMWVQ